jgi:putative transposase
LREQYAVSERRVCGLLSMAVGSYRYQSGQSDDELRQRLMQLAREKPRFGYRRLQVLLRRSGEVANHKRVYRVYRAAGLCLPEEAEALYASGNAVAAAHGSRPGMGSGFCA